MKSATTLSTYFLLLAASLLFPMAEVAAQAGVVVIPASYRLYMDNPAIAGLDGNHHLMIGANKDYFGINQSPTTSFIGGSTPNANGRIGFGGLLFHDRAGLIRNTQGSVFAAVHSNPANKSIVSLGVTAQFQFSQLAVPNVPDIIPTDGLTDFGVNLGLAINYRMRFGDECQNTLNLLGYIPQLPRTISFVNTSGEELTVMNKIPLRLQANGVFNTSGNLVISPALLWQSWPGEDIPSGESASIVDVSLGVGSKYGFEGRLGMTTGAANGAYLSIAVPLGISDWKGHIWTQPFGQLGLSGMVALEYEASAIEVETPCEDRIVTPNPPREVRDNPPVTTSTAFYEEAGKLTDRLARLDMENSFQVSVENAAFYNQVLDTYEFKDDDDFLLNPFEDQFYMSIYPLDKLANEIQHISDVAGENGAQIKEIRFIGTSTSPVNSNSEVSYEGQSIRMVYQNEGSIPQPPTTIQDGDLLSHGEISYLKLNAIRNYFQEETSLPDNIDMKVIQLEQSEAPMEVSRVLKIVVVIQK